MKRSRHEKNPEKRSQIGHLILILHFPTVHSLKEKRQILSGLLARIRERYPVSIAETGYHDLWQRAVVEAVMISEDPVVQVRVFGKIVDTVSSLPELELSDSHQEFL